MRLNPCESNWCHGCRKVSCWLKRMRNWLSIFSVLTLLVGCGYLPLKPGRSSFSAGATTGELHQSQNPKTESKQTYKRTEEAGKVVEEVNTTIGAAQKDVGREIAAKLSSMKGIMYLGALVFIFGAASAFWVPLKTVIGSTTTSAVIAASGLALIIIPTLVVGNEILILCISLGVAGIYWFSHRHGSLRGQLNAQK